MKNKTRDQLIVENIIDANIGTNQELGYLPITVDDLKNCIVDALNYNKMLPPQGDYNRLLGEFEGFLTGMLFHITDKEYREVVERKIKELQSIETVVTDEKEENEMDEFLIWAIDNNWKFHKSNGDVIFYIWIKAEKELPDIELKTTSELFTIYKSEKK